MNGEDHEGGERDCRDDPGNGSRTLDELSREEILRALAGLHIPNCELFGGRYPYDNTQTPNHDVYPG